MLTDEGPGFPFFLPKGMVIRNELENFWKKVFIMNTDVQVLYRIILHLMVVK